MNLRKLIRTGSVAAVLAGVLRTTSSFWPSPDPGIALELLYLVIDVLILLGLLAIYGVQAEQVGTLGFIGFLLAIVGTAIITGPDGEIGAVDMYSVGSLALGAGLVCLSVASWSPRTLPRWVALLWITSTTVGIAGAALGVQGLLTLSGITFGVALFGAGTWVWGNSP